MGLHLPADVRAMLEHRGLDPDVIYADLLADVRRIGGYIPGQRRPRKQVPPRPKVPLRIPCAWVLAPGEGNPFA